MFDMKATVLATASVIAFFAAIAIAHAHETDCSAALQRDAMAEYDTIAGMVGIPAGAPIYTIEKKQYVAAVCLHEELRGR